MHVRAHEERAQFFHWKVQIHCLVAKIETVSCSLQKIVAVSTAFGLHAHVVQHIHTRLFDIGGSAVDIGIDVKNAPYLASHTPFFFTCILCIYACFRSNVFNNGANI